MWTILCVNCINILGWLYAKFTLDETTLITLVFQLFRFGATIACLWCWKILCEFYWQWAKMVYQESFKNSTLRIQGLDKIEVNDSYPIKTGLRRYYDFIEQNSTKRNQKNNNEWFLEGEKFNIIIWYGPYHMGHTIWLIWLDDIIFIIYNYFIYI